MKIGEFLQPQGVLIDVAARSKSRLLQLLSASAADALKLPEQTILHALLAREKLGSTGVGAGVAIPHARIAGVAKPFGLFARLSKAIDFDAIDEVPVDLVFLLLMPDSAGKDHLNALACVARVLRSEAALQKIRGAHDATALHQALTQEWPGLS
jgi:PTS system nitrogen regulatory IIA component